MKKVFWVLLATLLLIGAALYNGFPLVTSDSGAYIDSGFKSWIPADRPVMYGLFIRHSSLAVSLWFTIIAQSLILSYLVWKALNQYSNPFLGRTTKLFIFIILVIFSSISWYSSQIMPDIFTSIGVLAMANILLFGESVFNKIIVAIIFVLACMVHNSNMMIFSMLAILVIPIGIFSKAFKNRLIKWKNYSLVLFLIVAAWLLSATINYGIGDKFEISGTPHAFLMAKNIENGIVDRYLDERCKDYLITDMPDSSLCFISTKFCDKFVDIRNVSDKNGEIVHQWDYTGAKNQQFYIIKVKDGEYKIISKNSNKCIEIDTKDTVVKGAKIIQNTYRGTKNQLFTFQHAGVADCWNIINKESQKVLDIAGASCDNGALVNLWDSTGADNQKFRIVKVPNCLCLFKDRLPSSAINFLWEENGVFSKTGAWGGSKEEYNKVLSEIYFSSDYVGPTIGEGIIATLRQLIRNDIGDGLIGYDKNSGIYKAIEKDLKYELKPFSDSRQSGWQLNFIEINKRHFWLLLFSMIIVILFFRVKQLRKSISNHFLLFIYICFSAIVCNAFVTGALANVLDRLQSRIVWFVPFIAIVLLFNYFVPKLKSALEKVEKR